MAKPDVCFEIDGITYPFVTTDDMSFDELRVLKRVSGMSPAMVDHMRAEFDPDAWLGILVVSAQRVKPEIDEGFFAKRKFGEIIDALRSTDTEEPQEAEEVPPPTAPNGAEGDGKKPKP